ncbi:hypothetical protein GCM10023195_28680 [Actinoallomurus liliacearum]|uniref:Uncharacterized protein n=1 Tax=Actinoallomurus liliacearum TaxID=1080073 RepID=A0ABP8TGD0_9ACTN
MRIPKRMALGISGLAFAGATALTLGAAAPAGAQTVSGAPQSLVTCGGGWGGCWSGWDCWDDCWDDCGC